jgi:hypothetical protein
MEEECFLSGGPVACWWKERWGVRRLGRLRRAGEVVVRGSDVSGKVGSEIDCVDVGCCCC